MKIVIITLSILILGLAYAVQDNGTIQVLNSQLSGVELSIPTSINFQGYLYRDGIPMDTTMNMWFGIYTALSGGSLLFQQTINDVEVVNGWFTVTLDNIPNSVFPVSGPTRYLEVKAPSTGPALSPRISLVSVGYSYHSITSDTAEYARQAQVSRPIFPPIETPEIGDYAVTNPKLGSNAVTTDKIANGTIKGIDVAKPCTLSGSTGIGIPILRIDQNGEGSGILAIRDASVIPDPAVHGINYGSGAGVCGRAETEYPGSAGVIGFHGGGGPGVYGYTSEPFIIPYISAGIAAFSRYGPGVYIDSAGQHGIQVKYASENGLQIDYAHAGIYIDSADWGGIYIGPVEYHGVWVESTGHAAIVIQNSGSDGVYIDSAAYNGVRIVRADDDGICMYRTGDDGVFVYKAGSDGIQIDTATSTGVYIKHARTYHGVHVERAQQQGFKVDRAGLDGVYVDSAGQHGIQVKHASENGLQIDQADNYGINIVNPDNHGVVVQKDVDNTAFLIEDTCWNGFWSSFARQAGYVAFDGNNGFRAHGCNGEAFSAWGGKRGLNVLGVDSQGVYIWDCGSEGIVVNHPGSYGMRITRPYPDGIKVDSAFDDGIEISNSKYGVYAYGITKAGVIGNGAELGGTFYPSVASGVGLRANAYNNIATDTAIEAHGKGLATGGWFTGFDDGEAPCVVCNDRIIIAMGSARLVNGNVAIEYPVLFKSHIRQEIPVRISLTPRGDPAGILCINEKDETGFTTRLKSIPGWDGEKDIEFDWIAYGTLQEPVTSQADIAAWEELISKKPSPVTSVPPPPPQPLTPSSNDKTFHQSAPSGNK